MERAGPGAPTPGRTKRRGCLKTGCLGCLGVVAVVAVGLLAMLLLALVQGVPETDRESRRLSQAIPAPVPDMGGTIPGTGAGPLPGRVILDVSMARFEIVPGPPGQPIHAEANYDSGSFHLEEAYEPGGEMGWTYRLTFARKVGWMRFLLGGADPENRVRLVLPRGVPISLSGRVGLGESHLELGGLWLSGLALDTGIGEHRISFREPLARPLEEMDLNGAIGELAVRGLGNASPRRLTLRHSVGEASFDLRGPWRRDAEIEVSCGIGECRVRLPDESIDAEVRQIGWTLGEADLHHVARRRPAPEGAPHLTVRVSATMGELTVRD
ncbi:MAG: hypothetical protein ACE5HD_04040 [Acidobacteriota bacterium]